MSMELLAAPHLERPGGYYAPEDAPRAARAPGGRAHHACRTSRASTRSRAGSTPSGQGADAAARDAAWLASAAASSAASTGRGSSEERVARWYRQLHIFLYPFYYIEYGIAQLGALQVWRNSLRDPAEAVAATARRSRWAARVRCPEIYAAAGARLVFDAETMGELVELVEDQVDRLRGEVPAVA